MGIQDRIMTVISTKGQIILPKAIREQRDWAAGTKLMVENTPEGVLLRPVSVFVPATIEEVFGSLPPNGRALSIEDMNAVIDNEAKRRARD